MLGEILGQPFPSRSNKRILRVLKDEHVVGSHTDLPNVHEFSCQHSVDALLHVAVFGEEDGTEKKYIN
jgi:hypothetical protein